MGSESITQMLIVELIDDQTIRMNWTEFHFFLSRFLSYLQSNTPPVDGDYCSISHCRFPGVSILWNEKWEKFNRDTLSSYPPYPATYQGFTLDSHMLRCAIDVNVQYFQLAPVTVKMDYFTEESRKLQRAGVLTEGTLFRHFQVPSTYSIPLLEPRDFRQLNDYKFLSKGLDYQANELERYPRRRSFRK